MLTGPINPVEAVRAGIECGLVIPPQPRSKPLRVPKNKHWKREPERKIGVLCCKRCGLPAEYCGDRLGWRLVCRGCELP